MVGRGAAVIGIGAVTGSRFANTDPRTPVRYLGAALAVAVAIAVASCFVFLLTTLLQVQGRRRSGGVLARRAGHHDGAGAAVAS